MANERVSSGSRSLTFAQAAQKAIELGGKFDGHELPADINNYTKKSATALAGQGLMGVARDNYGRDGMSKSYVAGFAEVEVDVETGAYKVLLTLPTCGERAQIERRPRRRLRPRSRTRRE